MFCWYSKRVGLSQWQIVIFYGVRYVLMFSTRPWVKKTLLIGRAFHCSHCVVWAVVIAIAILPSTRLLFMMSRWLNFGGLCPPVPPVSQWFGTPIIWYPGVSNHRVAYNVHSEMVHVPSYIRPYSRSARLLQLSVCIFILMNEVYTTRRYQTPCIIAWNAYRTACVACDFFYFSIYCLFWEKHTI